MLAITLGPITFVLHAPAKGEDMLRASPSRIELEGPESSCVLCNSTNSLLECTVWTYLCFMQILALLEYSQELFDSSLKLICDPERALLDAFASSNASFREHDRILEGYRALRVADETLRSPVICHKASVKSTSTMM